MPGSIGLWMAAQWIALAILGIGLTEAIWRGRARWSWCAIGLALSVLVMFDQHRLQPWVYQSLLYAIVIAGLPWLQARRCLIAITFSIYFYSAAGKLDFQFVHTVGSQMVQALTEPIGGVSDRSAMAMAFVLPACEITIAILIALPKTRRLGGAGAIGMHLTLIAMLGPWSLGHSWGVLVWNTLLATQSALLFVMMPASDVAAHDEDSKIPLWSRWAIRWIVIAALVAPLLERSGYWDHWTSWALYSPHSSRAETEVHRSAIDQLPPGIRGYLNADEDQDGWQSIDLGRWSLGQRLVPIYPQERYQLLLAFQIANRSKLDQAIRVKARSVSNRWTGRRQESFLIGRGEIESALRSYWLAPLSSTL